MTFQNMRLHEPIVNAIVAQGYEEPTPIQSEAIPAAMNGRDILGCAQTGTGKTCAFAVPILHRLAQDEDAAHGRRRPPRALVLCPTRELAMQIGESFENYGSKLNLRHTVVYGGVKQARQVRALREGVDVLIATPGRLLDLVNQGHIRLDQIETFVLDEADRMLDMGFIEDIRKVVDLIPRKHQTLFFSATVSKDIHRLADSLLTDPVRIETAPESTTVELIEQRLFLVKHADKPELLKSVLDQDSVDRVLVFTKTRRGADRLVRFLKKASIRSEAIHADKTQHQRTKAMKAFKKGTCMVLIATDIAARGIDVEDITHVVNYDMPIDPETYVHRIGRTARAGARGIAISFCDRDESKLLKAIERRSRIRLNVVQDVDALCTREFSGVQQVADTPGRGRDQRRDRGTRGSGARNDTPRGDGWKKSSKQKSRKRFDTGDRGDRGPRSGGHRSDHFGQGTRKRSQGAPEPSPRKHKKKHHDAYPPAKADRNAHGHEDRPSTGRTNDKPIADRTSFEKKPRGRKSFEKKSFEKKSFDKKPFAKKSFAKKPYGKKPYGKKPYGKQAHGTKPYDRTPPWADDRMDGERSNHRDDRRGSGGKWSKPKRSWNPDGRSDRNTGTPSKPKRGGNSAREGGERRDGHPWTGGGPGKNQHSGRTRSKGAWKPQPGKKKYQSRGWSKDDGHESSTSGTFHSGGGNREPAPRAPRPKKGNRGEPRGAWKKGGGSQSSKPRKWAPRSNGAGTSRPTGGAKGKASGFSARRGKGTRPGGKHAGASTKGQRPGSGAGRRPQGGWSARPGSSSHRKRTAKR